MMLSKLFQFFGFLYELTSLTRVQKCWCFELKYKYIWIWPPDLSHVLINCLEPSEQTNQSWSALQTLSLNPSNRQWNSKIIHYFLLTTVWGCPNNHSFISRDPHLKISTKTNLQTRFGLKHNSAVLAFPKGEQKKTFPQMKKTSSLEFKSVFFHPNPVFYWMYLDSRETYS